VQGVIQRSGYEDLIAAGIVMTGGTSKMEGAIDLAEEVFQMPVRLGLPQYVTGLVDVVNNPIHSTGVGLLLFGHQHQNEKTLDLMPEENLNDRWGRLKSWFQGNF
jgi:cell division protein FtsA